MLNKPDARTVLVVDDEQLLRDGAERILRRMDYRVFTASRGEEGLEVLQHENAGIVLLDMKMPGMDGMEALDRIMAMKRGILVIVITGFATVEIAIQAMKLGAYDFIPKPYEPDQLRIVVARAREKIELTQEAEKLDLERRRTLSDLHTEQSRMLTIVESLPNGVLVTNHDGQVVLVNPSFRAHMGHGPELGPGQPIESFIPDAELCRQIRNMSQGRYIDYGDVPSVEISPREGVYMLARMRPVLGEKGECLGAVVNLMDITAMRTLDQLKSEFVAKMTHELRSPLATIHEQLAMVLKEMETELPETGQHILQRAKEKTNGLIATISDLLDLSRIEAGIASKEPKPVQVDELLGGIVDFLGARAGAKHQSLRFETPDSPLPEIVADPMALESVFGNLIHNAITYTQEGGEIRIKAGLSGRNIRVEVRDNGYGIEAKHLEKIFDRFYRVKNDKTRFITGTGLGLPIVKGIVDSLGGYIDVESEFGKGSCFTVILPVEKC